MSLVAAAALAVVMISVEGSDEGAKRRPYPVRSPA